MLKLNVKLAKAQFFDRAVIAAADRARVRVLSRFGAFVRTRARGLIRSSRKTSRPGQPPRSHTGLLKRFVFFVFDSTRRSVVVGPALLSGVKSTDAPAALEHGGATTIKSKSGSTRTVTIAERPFMGPALDAELPKLPGLWRDSVK